MTFVTLAHVLVEIYRHETHSTKPSCTQIFISTIASRKAHSSAAEQTFSADASLSSESRNSTQTAMFLAYNREAAKVSPTASR